MHKMCSDERKCAVMKGYLCSDELRRNKWRMEYLLLLEHKPRRRHVKNSMGVCIEWGRRGVTIGNRSHHHVQKTEGLKMEGLKTLNRKMTKKRSSEFFEIK